MLFSYEINYDFFYRWKKLENLFAIMLFVTIIFILILTINLTIKNYNNDFMEKSFTLFLKFMMTWSHGNQIINISKIILVFFTVLKTLLTILIIIDILYNKNVEQKKIGLDFIYSFLFITIIRVFLLVVFLYIRYTYHSFSNFVKKKIWIIIIPFFIAYFYLQIISFKEFFPIKKDFTFSVY